jgi:hypothetical protein
VGLSSTVRGCCTSVELSSTVRGCCTSVDLSSTVRGWCTSVDISSRVRGCCTSVVLSSTVRGCCTSVDLSSTVRSCCTSVDLSSTVRGCCTSVDISCRVRGCCTSVELSSTVRGFCTSVGVSCKLQFRVHNFHNLASVYGVYDWLRQNTFQHTCDRNRRQRFLPAPGLSRPPQRLTGRCPPFPCPRSSTGIKEYLAAKGSYSNTKLPYNTWHLMFGLAIKLSVFDLFSLQTREDGAIQG